MNENNTACFKNKNLLGHITQDWNHVWKIFMTKNDTKSFGTNFTSMESFLEIYMTKNAPACFQQKIKFFWAT